MDFDRLLDAENELWNQVATIHNKMEIIPMNEHEEFMRLLSDAIAYGKAAVVFGRLRSDLMNDDRESTLIGRDE